MQRSTFLSSNPTLCYSPSADPVIEHQGDDGAGAMETDVEDDADTVADTKEARDASSPDGATARPPGTVEMLLRVLRLAPLDSVSTLRAAAVRSGGNSTVKPQHCMHQYLSQLVAYLRINNIGSDSVVLRQMTMRMFATCPPLLGAASRWRR